MLRRLIEAGARTWTWDSLSDVSDDDLPPNALCIARSPDFDDRSDLPAWRARERGSPNLVVRLKGFDRNECKCEAVGVSSTLRYRSDVSIRNLLQPDRPICIDISSLPNVCLGSTCPFCDSG